MLLLPKFREIYTEADREKIKRGLMKKTPTDNERFHASGGDARRQFCAYLQVHRPPEPLCNPRLREAATTLAAILGDSAYLKQTFLTLN
jgi:hypothetical protein